MCKQINIITDLKEMESDVGWIRLAQDETAGGSL
jgi:hypothetical protein